jgi:hypothetical protein
MTCTSHRSGDGTHVHLVSGEAVCSCSEAWRHECEARHVLGMGSILGRRQYLIQVEKNRGEKARERLQATILELHQLRRAA